jgi:hypothetical protein
MNKIIFVVVLTATLGIVAVAQDGRTFPPLTARENRQPPSTESVSESVVSEPVITTISSNLPFCPPKTCLYYAGDFDSANSNANALLNGFVPDSSLGGQVWVGVKPPKTATVTGATFNQLFTTGFIGTNPTPFMTRIDMVNGYGTLVCNTTGHAVLTRYGEPDFGLIQYSYTVKKLKVACKVQAGSKGATYINLLPESSNGYGYLANVEDAKPRNHRGWKNDLNDCYFAEFFDVGRMPPQEFFTCNSQGFGTNGFSELSIALTGKQ